MCVSGSSRALMRRGLIATDLNCLCRLQRPSASDYSCVSFFSEEDDQQTACFASYAAPVPSFLPLRCAILPFEQKFCALAQYRVQLIVEVLELLPEAFLLCQQSNRSLLSR